MKIFSDWKCNSHSFRIRFFLANRRLISFLYERPVCFLIASPLVVIHKILEISIGCEFSWKVKCGSKIKIYHGQGLIINPKTTIGENCTLRHSITLGARKGSDDAPIIGNNVDIGCNSIIIGSINIGDNVKIGAGSVVVDDVPESHVTVPQKSAIKK